MNEGQAHAGLRWKDTQGQEHDVLLSPERIRVEANGSAVDLPRERWPVDLYVARYGQGYLVRVETFEKSLQFILSDASAAPLLEILAPPTQENHQPPSDPQAGQSQTDMDEQPRRPLTWPKVSSLAVWALICSSVVFVPVVGWGFALVTILLLFLHHRRVRRTESYAHSRTMCSAAFVFMIAGAGVSVLATLSFRSFAIDLEQTSLLDIGPPTERNWGMIISGILVILISLSVHECAHAITAWWLGDGLARSLGRVTLNPLAHIDPIGTVLLPAILALSKAPIFFGYAKPVPVYVDTLPRYRRAHILISVAGPGSNLLLAAASLMLLIGAASGLRLLVPGAEVNYLASIDLRTPVSASGFPLATYFGLACTLLKLSFVVNLALAFFNLIPIPPLDGSWVLEHLFPRTLGPLYATIRPYGFIIFVAALYSGVLGYVRIPVDIIMLNGLALLAGVTGW